MMRLTPNGYMISLSPNGDSDDHYESPNHPRPSGHCSRPPARFLGLSQAQVAKRVGVSRKWIVEFEAGKPSAELGLALRVLDELGLALDVSTQIEAPAASGDTVDLDAVLEEHRGG